MWKYLYDILLQQLTVPWGTYEQHYQTCGRAVKNNFQINIYSTIGYELIGSTIFFIWLYYYYLNFRFGRYYSWKSWIFVLLLNGVCVWVITYLTSKNILDNPPCSVGNLLFSISTINFFYAAVLFFIISLIVKWASPMGKRTPF